MELILLPSMPQYSPAHRESQTDGSRGADRRPNCPLALSDRGWEREAELGL